MTELQSELRGLLILVVEDEYLVAAELVRALEHRGAAVIGPAGSIQDAFAALGQGCQIDAAVLDINLRGERCYPIADALRERGVPFIFATGYDACIIPETYVEVPRIEKPVDIRALARTFHWD
jgi:CheY-like chemotaxis protein